jgi:hypothetical protein
MRQLLLVVGSQPQHVLGDAEVDVPLESLVAPVLVPPVGLGGRHEVLHLHLLELAGAEHEVAGRDLVAERLADLGDPERRPLARRLHHVLEVHEHALRGLGPQVDLGTCPLDRPGVGLEHEVELACIGEAAPGVAVGALVGIVELVEAEPLAAMTAVHQRVGEVPEVARRLPDGGRGQDGGVDPDDVVAQLDHRAPPRVLDVAQQQHAHRPVVVGGAEAPVDLGRREHEAPSLAEVDDLVEQGGIGGRGHGAQVYGAPPGTQ